jgi:hypothetical protein
VSYDLSICFLTVTRMNVSDQTHRLCQPGDASFFLGVIKSESQSSETTEGYFKNYAPKSPFVFSDMQKAFSDDV